MGVQNWGNSYVNVRSKKLGGFTITSRLGRKYLRNELLTHGKKILLKFGKLSATNDWDYVDNFYHFLQISHFLYCRRVNSHRDTERNSTELCYLIGRVTRFENAHTKVGVPFSRNVKTQNCLTVSRKKRATHKQRKVFFKPWRLPHTFFQFKIWWTLGNKRLISFDPIS